MPFWDRYVPVAERRAKAIREMNKRRKKGQDIQPVEIAGRAIARSFWGKGWCDHLESFSDYANRLPRGRTYVRNGSVCHLAIQSGRIDAIVSGSELYNVVITIKKLKNTHWNAIKKQCAGQIGSMLELLQGKLSDQVMSIVTERRRGLFPQPGEIQMRCDCPDWAGMCKHVAAVLYGVGHRLDSRPELLFLLRDVDAGELIETEIALPDSDAIATDDALAGDRLGDIFGIDIDTRTDSKPAARAKAKTRSRILNQPPSTAGKKRSASAKKRPSRKSLSTRSSNQASAGPVTAAPPKIRPTGRSVARLRKQLNLSIPQFAKRLGVAAASVYRWEATSGRLALQARSLQALATLQQQHNKKTSAK